MTAAEYSNNGGEDEIVSVTTGSGTSNLLQGRRRPVRIGRGTCFNRAAARMRADPALPFVGSGLGSTVGGLKRTYSHRRTANSSQTNGRQRRSRTRRRNSGNDTTVVEDATIITLHSTLSAAVSLGSSSPTASAVGNMNRKRRKFESGGTTFQIVDDELSIEAPEVVSLLTDEEQEEDEGERSQPGQEQTA